MPRPLAELRRMDEEERRRARAHRHLRWRARWRTALWISAMLLALILLGFLARVAGFPVGP